LRVLAEARADGLDDETTIQRSPVVLALTAPAIRPTTVLPRVVVAPDLGQSCAPGSDAGVLREALRLRARWVQEVTGRAAWTLGERLTERGDLPHADAVRHLTLPDLEAIVTRRASTLMDVIAQHHHRSRKPLPARFQLSDRGRPIAIRDQCGSCGGTGAGGGTATGPVTFDLIDPPAGSVVVSTTLTPALGPVLPRLGGLVAETGSVLSHLAILAREFGIPIVVGYADATTVYAPGDLVTVNGDTGQVTLTEVLA
jgi:pyruvate,water dikinase